MPDSISTYEAAGGIMDAVLASATMTCAESVPLCSGQDSVPVYLSCVINVFLTRELQSVGAGIPGASFIFILLFVYFNIH